MRLSPLTPFSRAVLRWGGVAVATVMLIGAPLAARAQGETEIIRGRVLDPDGKPVQGASVVVTGLQSKLERTTKTNKDGVYTVLFNESEGQYVVTTRAVGYKPNTKRVVRKGTGSVFVTDFAMAKVLGSNEIATVNVVAGGGKPVKDGESVGGDERDLLRDGALFSLDPSDLSTFMSNIPGVEYTPGENGAPGKFSVLGAGEDENSIVVDGVRGSSARIPFGAVQSASIASTTFDASRGRFSGGQMMIRTRSGTNITSGSLRGSLSNPTMTWRDPAYITPPKTHYDIAGTMSGPVIKNKLFYFLSVDSRYDGSELQSLLNPNQTVMNQYGLTADTINAVNAAMQSLGVPMRASGVPNRNRGVGQSTFLKLNMNPTATTTLAFSYRGAWNTSDGGGASPTSYPARNMRARFGTSDYSLQLSVFRGKILNEFRSGVRTSDNSTKPYLAIPGGWVLVGSQFSDGRTGLTSLQFGGNVGDNGSSTLSWETNNETSWLTTDSKHQIKFSESFTIDRRTNSYTGDRFGTFAYQTLTDLANNTPTSYSRTLFAQARTTAAYTGAFSLGDQWKATKNLSFDYGLRLDIARSGTRPGYNPAVDSVFGRRTDRIPKDIGWSPRLGFSWWQGGSAIAGPGLEMIGTRGYAGLTNPGALSQIRISGGIGAFRSTIEPSTIAALVDATGLPNAMRQLTCVGAAVPIPDWRAFAANQAAPPTQCLDGTAPAEFSNDKPNVQLYDPSFHAPLSWRANLSVGGFNPKGWAMNLNTDLSYGYYGASTIDLNLNRTPMFTLANEGDRPVFVPTSGIVPTTGAIAPGASRISDKFGVVNNTVSDLRHSTATASLSANKERPLFDKIPLNVTYTWSRNRSQYRGREVAADPRVVEWATGSMPTHQIHFNTYFNVKWITFAIDMNARSGTPYTPIIQGDVNGDGQGGDRAFVFNPAATDDPVLAQQMDQLIARAPKLARECLKKNLGQMAARNSCSSGWRLNPAINIGFIDPSKKLSMNDRLSFQLLTQNTLSAITRMFRIKNTFLSNPMYSDPDGTLYYVDGFDPNTRQFKYRVNQQFGEARNFNGTRGRNVMPPFQVNLVGNYRIGGPQRRSFAQTMGLVPMKKDSVLTADQIHERLRRASANPLAQLLDMKDSLRLTEQQVADMEQTNATFLKEYDQLMAPVAEYVIEKGHKVDDRELMKRVMKARSKVQEVMADSVKTVAKMLAPDQRARLPEHLQTVLNTQAGG